MPSLLPTVSCRRSFTMFVLLCLALVAGTLAQVPVTCPGPKQFEGRFQRYDAERRETVRGFIGYDETQRRVRVFEDAKISGKDAYYDILTVFEQNIEYRVDRQTRKCNVTQPRFPFRPLGVPPEAKFIGEGVIGAAGLPGESVTVATFEGSFEENKYAVTVTYPDCFPVEQVFRTKDGMIDRTSFYDLQNGITDPELFLPPKECTVPV